MPGLAAREFQANRPGPARSLTQRERQWCCEGAPMQQRRKRHRRRGLQPPQGQGDLPPQTSRNRPVPDTRAARAVTAHHHRRRRLRRDSQRSIRSRANCLPAWASTFPPQPAPDRLRPGPGPVPSPHAASALRPPPAQGCSSHHGALAVRRPYHRPQGCHSCRGTMPGTWQPALISRCLLSVSGNEAVAPCFQLRIAALATQPLPANSCTPQ